MPRSKKPTMSKGDHCLHGAVRAQGCKSKKLEVAQRKQPAGRGKPAKDGAV